MIFQPYPFEKLNDLLKNIKINNNYDASILTIGEPQFETPKFIQKALSENSDLLKKYPKTSGETSLRTAQIDFFQKKVWC